MINYGNVIIYHTIFEIATVPPAKNTLDFSVKHVYFENDTMKPFLFFLLNFHNQDQVQVLIIISLIK